MVKPRARTVSLGLARSLRALDTADASWRDLAQRPPGSRLSAASYAIHFEQYVQAALDRAVQADDADSAVVHAAINDTFPRLTSLLTNSPSLGWALRSYAHYRALVGELDNLVWRFGAHSFELEYHAQAPGLLGAAAALGNFRMLCYLLRSLDQRVPAGLLRSPMVQIDIRIGWPVPAHLLQGLPADRCGIDRGALHRFKASSAFMWTALPGFDARRHALDSVGLDLELVQLQQSGTLTDRISAALADALAAGGGLGVEGLQRNVCERLAVSRWTLSRQLAEESTRFQVVLDQWRIQQALESLANEGSSLIDISATLGFSSPGSFTRFCQAQLRASPSSLRKALLAGRRGQAAHAPGSADRGEAPRFH